MSVKEDVVKDSSRYMPSVYISLAVGVVTGLVVRRFLGPSLMGMWVTLSLVLSYVSYCHLGVLLAAEREIPYWHGKKDYGKAEEVKNTTFGFGVITAVITGIVILISAFVLKDRFPFYITIGLIVISGVVLLRQFYNFYITLLRANKEFTLISKLTILSAVASAVLTIPLVIKFHLYGMYAVTALVPVITISYAYLHTRYPFSLSIKIEELKRLFKIGIVLLISSFTSLLLMSIDRIMVINMLGAAELGYYSIALTALAYIFTIPNTFGIIMFPRFQERYGETGDFASLKSYFITPTVILAYLLPLAIGVLYIGMPLVVRHFLPDYLPGLDALRILLAGVFFLSLTYGASHFLITINKQAKIIPFVASGALLTAVLNYAFIKLGWGINGVALGSAISYFLYSSSLIAYGLSYFLFRVGEVLRFFGRIVAPFLYSFGILVVLDLVLKGEGMSLGNDVFITFIKLVIFAILSIPLLWYINRGTGVVTMLLNQLGVKIPVLNHFLERRKGK